MYTTNVSLFHKTPTTPIVFLARSICCRFPRDRTHRPAFLGDNAKIHSPGRVGTKIRREIDRFSRSTSGFVSCTRDSGITFSGGIFRSLHLSIFKRLGINVRQANRRVARFFVRSHNHPSIRQKYLNRRPVKKAFYR